MILDKNFVPIKPFTEFKWKWACLQCTEGLNDPVVLLGVLFRMRKLEPLHLTYSSPEFAKELVELADDIKDSGIGVDLARRTGERNLIRNSGQYWRALGLIPPTQLGGLIQLTEFGRLVADRKISQSEFAAITIQMFKLPHPVIQSSEECALWTRNGLELHPLLLILSILRELSKNLEQMYLTRNELLRIIIPLSGCPGVELMDYVNFIRWNRAGLIDLSKWPDCCPSSNDHRIAREYLLFLSNYGYVDQSKGEREEERFTYNILLDDEIAEILSMRHEHSLMKALEAIRKTDVTSDIERKRVQFTRSRPNQARFRKDILSALQRCVITNVAMPEVLEAAHIKPFKYKGEDTIANGFCMRMDIHQLFDAGHLRIEESGRVELSQLARLEYGATIPPRIAIPDFINREFIRWRWENYNGI